MKIIGYFPRPYTNINAYHVVPFMSGFAQYYFGTAVSGATPVLTSFSAAPMYQFTLQNAQMPAGWLRGSVTDLVFSADDNYGYTPTPLRGINDNGTEHVYWPDNHIEISDCRLQIADSDFRFSDCPIQKNPAGGGGKTIHHRVSRDPAWRARFLGGAAAGAHENRTRAHRASELHVEPPVTDDEGPGRIEAEVGSRAIDQATRRLPAVARPRVRGHGPAWMVRTVVIRVDAGAARLEPRREVAMGRLDQRFTEVAARIPDWFDTTTTGRPARLSARIASTVHEENATRATWSR